MCLGRSGLVGNPAQEPGQVSCVPREGFIRNTESWERHVREESSWLYDGLWQGHGYFKGSKPGAVP